MTAGGWLFMLGSLGFVWGLAAWCVYRSSRAPSPPATHSDDDPSEPA
jgi:hypothetical protein